MRAVMIISVVALLSLIGRSAFAQTAPVTANVVSSCGTTNGAPYTAGQVRPITQDTTGKLCGSH